MTLKYLSILFLCISCSGTLSLIYHASRISNRDGVRPFTLFMASVFIYSLGYMFELSGTTPEEIFLALRIEYLGIPFLAVFWFLFAMEYSGRQIRNKALYASLFVIPAMTLVLFNTNEYHHLYYFKFGIDTSGPFPAAATVKGCWYYVEFAYEQLLSLAGIVLFHSMTRKTRGFRKKQADTIFRVSLFPWVGNLLGLLGIAPHGLDTAPFYLALTVPVAAFAMFRLRMFNITPVARAKVFETMHTSVLVLDKDFRIADFNDLAGKELPELTPDAIGLNASEVFSTRGGFLEKITRQDRDCLEIELDGPEGARHFSVSVTKLHTPRGSYLGLIILLYDITENTRLLEKLHRLASVDALTQVYSRHFFIESCLVETKRVCRYGGALPFLLIDIDHFKRVNDTFGHLAGDLVLRNVTSTFRSILRSSDIVGRYGGEEFAILLPETDMEGAKALAERLRQGVESATTVYEGTEISVTISVGIAYFSCAPGAPGLDGEKMLRALLKDSDQALYKAKAMGRNQVRWVRTSTDGVRAQ